MKARLLAPLVGATLFAALAPAQALAQDNNFTGFRVEGRVAWDSASASVDAPDPANETQRLTVSQSESGAAYGAEVGYDVRIGNSPFVVGAYAGVDFSDNAICGELSEDDLACVDGGRNISAGVRAGYALTPGLLVYARGGYSNGEVGFSYDANTDSNTNDLLEFSESRDGWHVGGGAEVAFNRNLYARLDYAYTRYGSLTFQEDAVGIGDPSIDVSVDRHQVFAGLGLRF